MESGSVTRLTKQIIRLINEEPGKKTKAVVQYISRSEQNLKDKVLHSARLSDGTFVANFLLYPSINDQFLSMVNSLDILEVGVLKKDVHSPFMLIYEFKIIYIKVRETVGNPVEYKPGTENTRGDEQLPTYLFEPQQSRSSLHVESSSDKRPPLRDASTRIDKESVPNNVLYTEIANLNMYDRNWSIRGRIIRKGELKRFRTASREGCVFNIVVKDETRAIQATFFNEMAEKYYSYIVEGKVYCFTDGDVKNASRFNSTDNKYEISFNERSSIREIPNDLNIANFHFNLVTIEEVQQKAETDIFDVIAIVDDPGALREINLKDGTSREKRGVSILDHTGYKIEITLWGAQAKEFQAEKDAIVLFQDVRVKEFQGKTLTTSMNSRVLMRIPECPQLKTITLFRNSRQRNTVALISLSESSSSRKMNVYKLGQLAEETESIKDEPDNFRLYFTVVAYSLRVINNLYYESCPNDSCLKKLTSNSDNTYYCEKCQKTFDTVKPRFMATFKIADDTGSLMITAPGDEFAQLFFNCGADRLKEMKDENEGTLNDYVRECLFGEYRMRLVAKKDFYNGETKIRYQLVKLYPVSKSTDVLNEVFYSFLTN